jgi:hypothetical protein
MGDEDSRLFSNPLGEAMWTLGYSEGGAWSIYVA